MNIHHQQPHERYRARQPGERNSMSDGGSKNSIENQSHIWIPYYLSWVWMSVLWISFLLQFGSQLYFLIVLHDELPLYLFIFPFIPMSLWSTRLTKYLYTHQWIPSLLVGIGFIPCIFQLKQLPLVRALCYGISSNLVWLLILPGWCVSNIYECKVLVWSLLVGVLVLWVILYSTYSMNPFVNGKSSAIASLGFNCAVSVFLYYRQYLLNLKASNEKRENNHRFRNHGVLLQAPSLKMYHSILIDPSHNEGAHYAVNALGNDHGDQDDSNTESVYLQRTSRVSLVGAGISLGGCVFVILMLFTGYSTSTRWTGIEPYPYSLICFTFLSFGVYLGCSPIFHNALSWIIAVISVGLFSFADHGIAYAGACLLAFITPAFMFGSIKLICSIHSRRNNSGYFISSLLITLYSLCMLSVCTGSSNGGNKAWISLLFGVVCYGMSCRIQESSRKAINHSRSDTFLSHAIDYFRNGFEHPPYIIIFSIVLLACFGQLPSTMKRAAGKVPPPPQSNLIPLQPVGMVLDTNHTSPGNHTEYHWDAFSKPLSVFQINMRQGYDEYGWNNLDEVIHLIHEQALLPHIIGLQEIEANFLWTGNIDIMEYMSYTLEMNDIIGSQPRQSTLGAGILSRYEVYSSNTTCFTSSPSQLSCASALIGIINETSIAPLEVMITQGSRDDFYDETVQGAFIAEGLGSISSKDYALWLGMLISNSTAVSPLVSAVFELHGCPTHSQEEYQFSRNLYLNTSECISGKYSPYSPIASVYYPM